MLVDSLDNSRRIGLGWVHVAGKPFVPAAFRWTGTFLVSTFAVGMNLRLPQRFKRASTPFVLPGRVKQFLLGQESKRRLAKPPTKLSLLWGRVPVTFGLGRNFVDCGNPLGDDEFGVGFCKLSNLDRGIVLRALAEFPRELFLAVELR